MLALSQDLSQNRPVEAREHIRRFHELFFDRRIGDLNEEQRALALSIHENSDRLLNITGELLKMTQVETCLLYTARCV